MSSLNPNAQTLDKALTIGQQFRSMGNVSLAVIMGLGGVFLVAALNSVNLHADKDEVGLDAQVLLKLAVTFTLGLYGTLGFLTNKKVQNWLLSTPGLWILLISCMYFVAVPTAISSLNALASAMVLVFVLLGTTSVMVEFGKVKTLNVVFYALAFYNVGSWFTYLAVPSIGVFMEPTVGGQFTARMSGLAHPNTLGQFSAFTVVIGTVLYTEHGYRSWFRKIILVMAAAALLMSLSRTSTLAAAGALAIAYRQRFLKKEYATFYTLFALFGGLTVIALLVSFDLNELLGSRLESLTKSGDVSELTTATGRAEIWAYAWNLILDKPLTGYGAASSKYLLAEYSLYTHNLLLNVALSTGIIGGIFCLMMIVGRVFNCILRPNVVADAMIAVVLLNGLFENVIFSILAGLPTIVWIVAIFWGNDGFPGADLDDEGTP